ncbi:hypothetical protein BDZ91DRAFT_779754 [Kalaharituber pfeilii]|nr:hypothetical protein BDZ91DRAFT_779754 [Kalaharituber pfeilii]
MASDAASHASTTDFYALLSLPPEYSPSASVPIPPPIPPALLRKSYRKTSLRYHPDKNPSPDAVQIFHLLTTAYGVLSDPATKAAYDNALVARLVRKRKVEGMEGERRRLKEELEDPPEARGRGARLRMKKEEALRRAEMEEKEEEERRRRREAEEPTDSTNASMDTSAMQTETSQFSDLDRTLIVKLRRPSDPADPQLTSESIMPLFTPFGEVSDCLIRDSPTSTTPSNLSKKRKLLTAVVVFKDIKDAHAAVCAFRDRETSGAGKGNKDLWERVKEVKWAGGRGEDWRPPGVNASSTPKSPAPERNGYGGTTSIPTAAAAPAPTPPPSLSSTLTGNGTTAAPRFSFRPPGASPSTPSSSRTPGMSAKDYESVTLMRMREMAQKMRKEREEEAKAEGGEGGE